MSLRYITKTLQGVPVDRRISKCLWCENMYHEIGCKQRCKLTDNYIDDCRTVPDHCPLPVVEEGEQLALS